jgi:hypothetical protein
MSGLTYSQAVNCAASRLCDAALSFGVSRAIRFNDQGPSQVATPLSISSSIEVIIPTPTGPTQQPGSPEDSRVTRTGIGGNQ